MYLFRMTVYYRITLFFFMMYVWLLLFIRDVHILIISIDSLTYFCIVTLLLCDYLTFLDMHILIFLYLVHIGVIDSLYCILSYLSQYIVYSYYTPILLIIFLPSLCVDMSDILVICMTAWCMTDTLLCDECISCLCGTHIYHFTSNSLVLIDFVFLVLAFDMRLVALFALRPS